MRPLRYSINVTLDGCCDHRAIVPDEELHRHHAENLAQADALLFGRVTYEMMEAAFRPPAGTGARSEWTEPFARTIDAAKKYVVSSTLDRVDWNAELVRGDLGKAVQQLKRESGKGLFTGGVKLPLALVELGLIDEYDFVVHPRLAWIIHESRSQEDGHRPQDLWYQDVASSQDTQISEAQWPHSVLSRSASSFNPALSSTSRAAP
jgi:dihydrofolate reductase